MKILLYILLSMLFVFVGLVSVGLAQPTKESRIKDFGSSLNQNSGTNKNDRDKKTDDTIRIETNLVVNDVLVLDKDFHTITGLKKEDFIVKEDDKSQEIETFSPGDAAAIPRSIVLIIDYSGSQLPYIKNSVEAAKVLVDKLNPKDRMAIVTDDVRLLVDFTEDKQLLKKKLDSLIKDTAIGHFGKSMQYSSLMATLNELFDRDDIRPIIIFQTDGDEFGALKQTPINKFPPPPPTMNITLEKGFTLRNFSYEDMCAKVEESRAVIYTIIPGIQLIGLSPDEQLSRTKIMESNRIAADMQRIEQRLELSVPTQTLSSGQSAASAQSEAAPQSLPNTYKRKSPADIVDVMPKENLMYRSQIYLKQQMSLAGVAKLSGGWNDYLEKPEQANEVYSRILSGINHRYIIGYYSNNEAHDGKMRSVKIEVQNHPDYTVWGRKTYLPATH